MGIKEGWGIDEYGQFTEEIWFSKHQLDCALLIGNPEAGESCDCDQDPERSLMIMTMGLAGEVGEVMELLKKRVRDGKFELGSFVKEMGDVAYYWARLARHFDIHPSVILERNVDKLLDRQARGMMRGSGNDR